MIYIKNMAFATFLCLMFLGGNVAAQSSATTPNTGWNTQRLIGAAITHQSILEHDRETAHRASRTARSNTGRIDELTEIIDGQNAEIDEMRSDLAAGRITDEDFEVRLSVMEGEYSTLRPEFDALEVRVADLEQWAEGYVAPTLNLHGAAIEQLFDRFHLGIGIGGVVNQHGDPSFFAGAAFDSTLGLTSGRLRMLGSFGGGVDGAGEAHIGGSFGVGFRTDIFLPSAQVFFDSDRGSEELPDRVTFTTAFGPEFDVRWGELPISSFAAAGYGKIDDDGIMRDNWLGRFGIRAWAF